MLRKDLIFVIAAAALTTGCGETATITCESAHELDSATDTCVPAPPRCEAGAANSIAGDCAAQQRECFDSGAGAICGICVAGFHDVQGTCTAVHSCADIDCATQGRICIQAGPHTDAECGSCIEGSISAGSGCVVANCDGEDLPGSISAGCTMQSRVCTTTSSSATCGACFAGFIDNDGQCEPVKTCAELGCVEAHRTCAPAGAHSHAVCGDCMVSYAVQQGVCRPLPNVNCGASGTKDSIRDACDAEHRNCVLSDGKAVCGGCQDGFVENSAIGICEVPITCADLDCSAINRSCAEEPNGHCTGCMDGYTESVVTGSCDPVLTCADVTCESTEECAETAGNSSAFCRTGCGPMAIWSGSRCEPCPPCDGPGEVKRWPWPAATGACICETQPGFFYSLSADVGPFLCDADGDGWVRESARISLESDDPALRTNARCDLRTIDRFELKNESGESLDVLLNDALALYETDRNDDDTILNAIWDARGFPAFGRRPLAAELNRLTKVCHDLRMDYNDNGAADVKEWGDRTLGSAMRPEQRAFNQMSYFVELHRGWYEDMAGATNHGRYVVAENSRLLGPSVAPEARVPIQYEANDPGQWRVCEVKRDVDWQDQIPPLGMDLATYMDPTAPSFSGMHHHSQFKCLIADPDPDGSLPTEVSPLDMAAFDYRLSRCQAGGEPVVQSGNPTLPVVTCDSISISSLAPGDVVWAGMPYLDHGRWVDEPYERGCYNQCIDALPECPGYDINPAAVNCLYDPLNFGKFLDCSVWEVCDGLDNNGNSIVDEGDPDGNLPCDTGENGRCSAGTTHCINGVVECFRNVGPIGELCNAIDDNCDGDIDEGDPEGNVLSCDTGELGICNNGRLHCEDGALELCIRSGDAQDEVGALGCNGLDDNCDGTVDEAPKFGCVEPWLMYYDDVDGDGQGSKTDPGTCMCEYQSAAPKTATNKTDCCDDDEKAYDGANRYWYSRRNKCSSFDYNCDGIEQKLRTVVPGSGCGVCFFCGCNDSASGWVQAPVPSCGDEADYYEGCNWVCDQQTTLKHQVCQ